MRVAAAETLVASPPPQAAAAAAAAALAFSVSAAPTPAPSASARSDSASSFPGEEEAQKGLATRRAPSPALRAHASRQHAALNASRRSSVASGALSGTRRAAANLAASAAATPSGLRLSHARVKSARTSAVGASFTPPRAHAASTRLCSSEPSRRKRAFLFMVSSSPKAGARARLSAARVARVETSALARKALDEVGVGATSVSVGSPPCPIGTSATLAAVAENELRTPRAAAAVSFLDVSDAYTPRIPKPSRRSSPPHVPVVLRSLGPSAPRDASPMIEAPASIGSRDSFALALVRERGRPTSSKMARTASLARSRTCLCGASPLSGCGAPVCDAHARTTTLCLAIFCRNVAGALTQNVLIARSAFDLTTSDLLSHRFERYSAQSSTWSGDMKRISFASSSSMWAEAGWVARGEEGAVRGKAGSVSSRASRTRRQRSAGVVKRPNSETGAYRERLCPRPCRARRSCVAARTPLRCRGAPRRTPTSRAVG